MLKFSHSHTHRHTCTPTHLHTYTPAHLHTCTPTHLHTYTPSGSAMEDARHFGWEFSEAVTHSWTTMVEGIQRHIGSLNWGYRVALRDKGVKYINGLGEFTDPHTIKVCYNLPKISNYLYVSKTACVYMYECIFGVSLYSVSTYGVCQQTVGLEGSCFSPNNLCTVVHYFTISNVYIHDGWLDT